MLVVLAAVGGMIVGLLVAHVRRTGRTPLIVLVSAALTLAFVATAYLAWSSAAGRLPWIAFLLAYVVTYAASPLEPRRSPGGRAPTS